MPSFISTKSNGVNQLDILMIIVAMFFTLFITYAWEDRLSTVFFALSLVAVPLYIIATTSGFLSNQLNLKRPLWTAGGIIGIPVWILINAIPSSSYELTFSEENPLVQLFGVSFFNNATQSWIIPLYETMYLVAILVGIFIVNRQANNYSSTSWSRSKSGGNGLIALILLVASVGALMHYVVALELAKTTFSFNYIMLHQFISFYIFALSFAFGGLPFAGAMHAVKNLLVYGTVDYIVITFGLFILLDLIALRQPKSNSPRGLSRQSLAF